MKISYNAPVVLSFIILSLAFLGVDALLGADWSARHLGSHGAFWGDGPLGILGGVTHVLGHAGAAHYVGNMTFILLLGPILEEKFGSLPLFFMIVITALVTAVLNGILFGTSIIGASGIVFMMIILSSFTSAGDGKIPLTFVMVLVIYVGNELITALRPDNISHFAHIAGGISGAVFGAIYRPKRPVSPLGQRR